MRASINSGFRLVGSQEYQSESAAHKSNFKPRVTLPDPEIKKKQDEYGKAIQSLVDQINGLITLATEPEEVDFWEARLNSIKGANNDER